jgi:putative Ca2+/H+ antiporter (TMEM165/GDT1 family)
MDWYVFLLTFALIFPVELPDKTFVAALVLSTRYRPLLVWVGVGLAFGAQCVVAVTAGKAVSYLPAWVVGVVSTVMFAIGAFVLFREAPRAAAHEKAAEDEYQEKASESVRGVRVVVTSFLVLFAAEWGDLSQLLTLNIVAKYGSPLAAFLGSWLALLAVSGLAVVSGQFLLRHIRLSLIHYFAGTVCLVFVGVGAYHVATG